MASEWVQHCKNYAKQHGCSYKEAMTRAKSSYTPKTGGKLNLRKTVSKARNVGKKVSNVIDKHGHLVDELDKSGKVSKNLRKVNNTIGTINDVADTIDGGKFNLKKAVRKTRNTARKVSKNIDRYAPLVEMVAPELAPEIETVKRVNQGVKRVNGSGNPYILKGGSFKTHGSGLGYTQSSMISPQHPSFDPKPPKSIRKRQVEN